MKVKIMYHGERVYRFRIQQLFKDKRGKEHYWTGIKYVQFGSIYEAEKKDKHFSLDRKPLSVEVKGWEPTEQERLTYESQKLVAKARRQENRKAMELSRPHNDITRAVNLLRPFFRQLNRIDQERFSSYLSNEMSKKVGKK